MTNQELKDDEKAQALLQHIKEELQESDVKAKHIITHDGENYEYTDGGMEFRVLTDDEADDANDESIESYINECILPEIPEAYQNYFDYDAFKSDARMDGRGHNLNYYDGTEYEEQINGTWYYIYRTN